ncbi:MAG TPA: hypothetical protein P5573_08055 [Syntrophales bacterium]|nr:hypothetical protein [Syntrophales bacterium]
MKSADTRQQLKAVYETMVIADSVAMEVHLGKNMPGKMVGCINSEKMPEVMPDPGPRVCSRGDFRVSRRLTDASG